MKTFFLLTLLVSLAFATPKVTKPSKTSKVAAKATLTSVAKATGVAGTPGATGATGATGAKGVAGATGAIVKPVSVRLPLPKNAGVVDFLINRNAKDKLRKLQREAAGGLKAVSKTQSKKAKKTKVPASK